MKLKSEAILDRLNEHWNQLGLDQAAVHDQILNLETLLLDYRTLVGPLTFREPAQQDQQKKLLERTATLFGEEDL